MKKEYKYLILTNQPAFYKINLYNKLNKKIKIFVIFIGAGSTIRNNDFLRGNMEFEYLILNNLSYEKRNMLKSLLNLISNMKKIKFKRILVSGWELPEYWLAVFLNKKNINSLYVESSDFESKTGGLKGLIKKLFLRRISYAFPSGEPHLNLLNKLGFKGKSYKTLGVGIFNKTKQMPNKLEEKNQIRKFLYVGRLSEEKNLKFLIEVFNEFPNLILNIVGDGNIREELEEITNKNVNFLGYIKNNELSEIYANNDVFILPSISETWGLVVEEALYNGLPVLVSDRVGCSKDLIEILGTGITFEFDSKEDLIRKVNEIIDLDNYVKFRDNIKKIDFDKRDEEQVNVYIKALEE